MDQYDKQLDTMQQDWSKVPVNIQVFSRTMLALGTENKLNEESNDQAIQTFKKLRTDTTRDGLVYCREVLPVAKTVVMNLSDYFDNYEVLTYQEWKEDLALIHQEVSKYQICCEVLVQMHIHMLTTLKTRKAKADEAARELADYSEAAQSSAERHRQEAQKQKAAAEHAEKMGNILAPFTLGISAAVGGQMASDRYRWAREAEVEARAKAEQAMIALECNSIVNERLIPALEDFIKGVDTLSRFFAMTEQSLAKIVNNTVGEDFSRRTFKKSQFVGREINFGCKHFAAIIPTLISDMNAIPSDSSAANYIERWRKESLKQIEEEFQKKPSAFKSLWGNVKAAMGSGGDLGGQLATAVKKVKV